MIRWFRRLRAERAAGRLAAERAREQQATEDRERRAWLRKHRWSKGDRVYVPGEGADWPLGNGTVTDTNPDFRRGDGFVTVTLDEPAQRHSSDGPPQRHWFCRASSLQPAHESPSIATWIGGGA